MTYFAYDCVGAIGRDWHVSLLYWSMVKRRVRQQSFDAVGANGSRKRLDIFVDIIDAGHFGDPDAEIEGMKAIRTSDGESVNWLGSKKYQVVSTGEILTSDDPKAP